MYDIALFSKLKAMEDLNKTQFIKYSSYLSYINKYKLKNDYFHLSCLKLKIGTSCIKCPVKRKYKSI